MMLWILLGVMTCFALAFVLLPVIKPGMARKPLLIAGGVVILPLAAILIYQKIGAPVAATQPPMAMPPMQQGMPSGHPGGNAMMNMDLGKLADKLAEKLKSQPDNADGWALLARTYVELKRHKESLPAFEKAMALVPKDPQLMVDYADALAVANGGKFDKQSQDLIDKALAADPANVKALMLKATIDFNAKNYSKAVESWEKILKVPGISEETTKEARGSIDEARKLMNQGK